MYTLGTRTIRKPVRLGLGGVTEKTVVTIEYDGRHYTDVPEGEDAQEMLAILNEQERRAIEYRGQFATEEEWLRHLDDAAGG